MDMERLAGDIVQQGIKAVFGIPGSGSSLSLLDALEKQGIAFHLNRFEGSGVLMAATTGRLSGRAGVSMSIKGPGLANSVPGLAASWFEAFPVVHLTEATPGTAPPWQVHKRMDHHALVKAVSKGIFAFSGDGHALRDAFALSQAEEPGPVVLELTEKDDPALPGRDKIKKEKNLDRIMELIRQSQRPVVIAGALSLRRGWSSWLNRLNIPVFSTAAAKGVADETLSQSAGVYTGAGRELTPESSILPRADLVVCLGLTAREVLAVRPFQTKSVNIEAVETPGRDGFNFDETTGIEAARPVLEALQGKLWGLGELDDVKAQLNAYMSRDFLPGQVFQVVNRHFQGRARTIIDTGYFCTIGEHALLAQKADQCLLSGQGRYMGTGLPMALGASLHDPGLPHIAFLGDGGIGMYMAEARLAVQNKLPLLIILMTDNFFGSIRTRAIKDGLTQKPLTFNDRSWVGCFEAMGIPGVRAENPAEVETALSGWDYSSGPVFLEIPFDPDKYEAMVRGIR